MFFACYSRHDAFAGESFVWVGTAWFGEVLTSREFYGAAACSLGFSLLVLVLVLAIQIPLGIYIALRLASKGLLSSVYIVLMTITVPRS